MTTGADYRVAIVLINRHEPEGEVAGRLLTLAEEKGYDLRSVEASRGEHDVSLSFRVPEDVAEEFNADRAERWPDKIENDGEKASEQDDREVVAGVNGDAYAADQARSAQAAAATNAAEADADTELVDDDNDPNTPPVRKSRTNKQRQE